MRDLRIYTVLNGWVVRVGCQVLVYRDMNELANDFKDYLKDANATEKRLLGNSPNKKITMPDGPLMTEAAQERERAPDIEAMLGR